MARMDPDESRRTGAAVQIFVGAANREIGVADGQAHLHRTGRMGQIPQRQRPLRMDVGSQRLHVVQVAAAVIDMG